LQMKEIEGKKLAAGPEGAKHVVVKGMSHVLKETDTTDPVEQSKTVYQDVKSPLHPKLVGELADFLKDALAVGK